MMSDSELARVWQKNVGHLPNFRHFSKICSKEDRSGVPLKAPGTPRGERTARERWQLLRTVSRVGLTNSEGNKRRTTGNTEECWTSNGQRKVVSTLPKGIFRISEKNKLF